MELDEETLKGHWSIDNNSNMEFFIIDDAIFSKLCILGEDVEPCFEGARVTAPDVSTTFTKVDDNFKKTLFTMMQDLKFALEGGKNMDMEQNLVVEETIEEVVTENNEEVVETEETPATEFDSLVRNTEPVAEEVAETVEENPAEEEVVEEETVEEPEVEVEEVVEEEISEEENLTDDDNSEQSITAETEECIEATLSSQENFAKSDDEEKDEDKEDTDEESNDEETNTDEDKDDKDDEEDEKKKYSLLEESYNTLQAEYAELNSKYEALVEFKNQVDNEKKDALINSFYMLSDEDKQEVIENKANYSLDDIEAKLSVICVRKKVNFDLDDTSKNDNTVEEENVMTYSLSGNDMASTPAWITALKNTRDNRK